jgi:glutamine synthetase type III
MREKIILALKNAEKNYSDYKNLEDGSLKLPVHIAALHALFDSFIYYGVAVSQTAEAISELEEESYLFEVLIEPHLRVVDDIDMIARQYTPMFVKYIAQIAQGIDSKRAVEKLFA